MPDMIPLVSLAEIKEFCDLSLTPNAAKDARLMQIAAIATDQIADYTGRIFTQSEVMEFQTSKDAVRNSLDMHPHTVADPISTNIFDWGRVSSPIDRTYALKGLNVDPETVRVFYDPRLNFGPETELTRGKHFEVDVGDTLVLHYPTRYKLRALKLLYSAGFAAAPTPPADPGANPPISAGPVTLSASAPVALKEACLYQIQFLRVKSKPDNVGMEAERTAGSKDKVVFSKFLSSGGLTPEARALVNRYRRVNMGAN